MEVSHMILLARESKRVHPDNIPPKELKFCAPVLATHLAITFNALLNSEMFPSVMPIFKSGGRDNVDNFGPVIKETLAKVFQALALDHLSSYLKKYTLDSQHGGIQIHFLRVLEDRLGYDCLGVPIEELQECNPLHLMSKYMTYFYFSSC
ncbi:hypothetical protein J6590_007728 [Homalodisca vitripennis]|nr:hypothetical protein J6590_007728 [Homalodisca vitripennis]